MSSEFIFIVSVVLLSRLVYLFRDGPLNARGLVVLFLVQCVGLLAFDPGIPWAILLALLLLTGVAFHRLEKPGAPNKGLRLMSLALQVILLSVFLSPWIGVSFNSGLFVSLSGAGKYSVLVPLIGKLVHPGAGIIVMGGLLVSNEANILLRLLLGGLRVGPEIASGDASSMTAADRREYNTGRVIGILERIIIYGAVLTGEIAAIGLVLAVKGFARFKEMDNRPFAEYVLVGTLLSLLLAIVIALIVKSLLQYP